MPDDNWLALVRFGPDGLVPVVAQDGQSGDVLMVAWASREALLLTHSSGRAHYHSRSRNSLWQKGETSGNVQDVTEIRLDCDGDTVLYRVTPAGPACHTGARTCFSTRVRSDGTTAAAPDPGGHTLSRLASTIAARASARPEDSYTASLLRAGLGKVAQKVGEEAVEVVVASTTEDPDRLASETADLLYHLLVLLELREVPLARVWEELARRAGKRDSGTAGNK